MTSNQKFVLPTNLIICQVADVSPAIQLELGSPEDFVLTLDHSRTPSKVVERDLADLLQQFKAPTTIVNAILAFTRGRQVDPEAVLETVFLSLKQLVDQQFLVPENSEKPKPHNPGLRSGDSVDDFTIDRAIQTLEDSEVYQARAANGTLCALKVYKGHQRHAPHGSVVGEMHILKSLRGAYHPRVLSTGVIGEDPYLALEWIEGSSIDRVSAGIRRRGERAVAAELIPICLRALEAFSCIHSQGVVHGDIHPDNILVDRNGNVRIIDFSLSMDVNSGVAKVPRGGVSFFLDPEFAGARLRRQRPPIASFLSDEFSLAAVLYLCLSGQHYAAFSLERVPLLRQICEDRPRPFPQTGDADLKTLQSTVLRALEKHPSDRYGSIGDWLSNLTQSVRTIRRHNLSVDLEALRSYSYRTIEEFGLDTISTLPTRYAGPLASINYGAAGIAYGLLKIATAFRDPSIFATADAWCVGAESLVPRATAFVNDAIGITSELIGPVSVYHGVCGVRVVQATVAAARGDVVSTGEHVQEFINSGSGSHVQELTFGSAGALLGATLILEAMPDTLAVERSSLIALGRTLAAGIETELAAHGLQSSRPITSFLGIAHGWAGILYALLRWCKVTGDNLSTSTEEAISAVSKFAIVKQRGLRWPRKLDGNDSMSGWCNGSAGFVHLWALASECVDQRKYATLAEGAAWDAFEASELGADLCCGLAGRSYALLRYFQLTRKEEWLERAISLAVDAILERGGALGSVYSLWKGPLGLAVLSAELQDPEVAAMPMF